MYRKIFLSRDNWISNKRCIDRGFHTCSSHGADESLQVFKYEEEAGDFTYTYAKILWQIDKAKITDLGIAAGTAVKYELCLSDLTHEDTLPYSYDLDTFALVSRSWDEGRGVDSDGKDSGASNWLSASSNVAWFTTGAFDEYLTTKSGSYHFDQGWEDYKPGVSELVSYWLSGNTNYGAIIKLNTTEENDASEYWRKSFYSRHCKDLTKRPYLEIEYDDASFDDRQNVYKDETSGLWLRRYVNGELKDFNTASVDHLYVKVQDVVSGTALYTQHFTASYVTTGSYSASFTISSTGSYSGSTFHDIWYSGSTVYYSGTFSLRDAQTSSGTLLNNIRVAVTNLKPVYQTNEKARLRVILEDTENYRDTVLSASYQDTQIYSKKLYWGVKSDVTNETWIPFCTGSYTGTRMGYDAQGHRADVWMDSFVRGHAYRLVLYLEHNGERKVFDDGWRFKVV